MNAAIIFSIHGSIEEILKKHSGNTERVSEFLMIKKFAQKFDKIFVFSHDTRDYSKLLPHNCEHIRLQNRFFYIIFGWLVILFNVLKHDIKYVRAIGAASLPALFLVNKITKAKTTLKYYYLWYNTASNPIKRLSIKYLERFYLHFVDFAITANRETREFAGKEMLLKDVREGIITDIIDKAKPDASLKRMGGKKIIFVGRLSPIKDPITAIKAYRIAKKQIPGLKLIICGDGELLKECKKISDRDVKFLGFVENIPSLLKASDIYVLTSLYDASPRALMEAMAAGLPIIATKVGGVPEYVTPECGILVEPQKPEKMAREITRILKNPKTAKRLGKSAKSRAKKFYDLEKNLDNELEFLKRALK